MKSIPSLQQIAIFVLVVHFGFLLFAALHDAFSRTDHPRRPIAVRFVAPAIPTVTSVKPSPPPQKTAAPSKVVSPPKSTASQNRKSQKKKETQPVKPAPQEKNPPLEMLESLARRFEEIKTTPAPQAKRQSDWKIPASIQMQKEDDAPAPLTVSYGELLASFLEGVLEFPEQGEVKAKLFLSPQGELIKVEIVEARSQKNRDYLKNRLPELEYPCFNDRTSEPREFSISFRNEERR